LAELLPNCPYVLDAARPKPKAGAWWGAVRRRRGGPTSSGKLHHASVDERRKLTEELRAAYHDRIVRAHAEYERLQAQKQKDSAGVGGRSSAPDAGHAAGGVGDSGGAPEKGVEGGGTVEVGGGLLC